MDFTLGIFVVVGFLAVVLALEGGYNIWVGKHSAEAKRITERLKALSGETYEEISLEREEEKAGAAGLDGLLEALPFGKAVSEWSRASGLKIRAGDVLAWSLALALCGVVLVLLLGYPLVLALTVGLVLAVIPWFRVSRARSRRIARMENQFPEALDLMCRAMRAGHAFPTAIRTVGTEMSDPVGRDFRILADELNFGVPIQEALGNLTVRMPLGDVRFFMVAILIQRETGGNLAELLEKISAIVRARLKLMGEVRTLSAEGRLSAIILTCLPFGAGGMISLVNPQFMRVLFEDPVGLKIIGVALLMMVLGILWMRKIIRIRV